jgi:hypothetical protein
VKSEISIDVQVLDNKSWRARGTSEFASAAQPLFLNHPTKRGVEIIQIPSREGIFYPKPSSVVRRGRKNENGFGLDYREL